MLKILCAIHLSHLAESVPVICAPKSQITREHPVETNSKLNILVQNCICYGLIMQKVIHNDS
jgi:hypothetical protein